MAGALEIRGAITTGGLAVLTTGTSYTKTQTLTEDEITGLLTKLLSYVDTHLSLKHDLTSIFTKTQQML